MYGTAYSLIYIYKLCVQAVVEELSWKYESRIAIDSITLWIIDFPDKFHFSAIFSFYFFLFRNESRGFFWYFEKIGETTRRSNFGNSDNHEFCESFFAKIGDNERWLLFVGGLCSKCQIHWFQKSFSIIELASSSGEMRRWGMRIIILFIACPE